MASHVLFIIVAGVFAGMAVRMTDPTSDTRAIVYAMLAIGAAILAVA